jgi:hypothetical protein
MWMTDYIKAIQQHFIDVLGFEENSESSGCPINVPDGEYKMLIDGKVDRVVIKDGMIHCCNFD